MTHCFLFMALAFALGVWLTLAVWMIADRQRSRSEQEMSEAMRASIHDRLMLWKLDRREPQ
jgi:hypothetical protein